MVYKKFGRQLEIWDLTKRDKDGKPTLKTKLVSPDYKMNVWNFKAKVNTQIAALYADTISVANLEGRKCKVCDSSYRVEMHHVRMMKDLSPDTNRLDYLMSRAYRKQIPLCRSCHVKHHKGTLQVPESKIKESKTKKKSKIKAFSVDK